jgi:hypothetical protein
MIQHVKLLCNEPKQRATDLGKPVNSSLANTSYPILNPTPTASHCELLTSFHSSTRAVPKPERLNPAVGAGRAQTPLPLLDFMEPYYSLS